MAPNLTTLLGFKLGFTSQVVYAGAWRVGQRGHNSLGAESGAESLRGVPKSPNNVTSTFFNTVNLLLKDLRFKRGCAKRASCPGSHLTPLRLWVYVSNSTDSFVNKSELLNLCFDTIFSCVVLLQTVFMQWFSNLFLCLTDLLGSISWSHDWRDMYLL